MKKLIPLLSCIFILSLSGTNVFAIKVKAPKIPKIVRKIAKVGKQGAERVEKQVEKSAEHSKTEKPVERKQIEKAIEGSTHSSGALPKTSTVTGTSTTPRLGTGSTHGTGSTGAHTGSSVTGTGTTPSISNTPGTSPSITVRTTSRTVAQETVTAVDTELKAIKNFDRNGYKYRQARQNLLENEDLFKTFKKIGESDKYAALDFLETANSNDIKTLNYWYSTISDRLPDVKGKVFEGLKSKKVRGRLTDNRTILANFKLANEADQVQLLKYLENASDADVAALEALCQKPLIGSVTSVDRGMISFLKEEPAGQNLLESLKEKKLISEEGYNQIRAFEGDFDYTPIWMNTNRDGVQALRYIEKLFAEDSNLTKQFFDSPAGRGLLEDWHAFARDVVNNIPAPSEMRFVFEKHFERIAGTDPWYAAQEVASGFPRYHVVDSGNGYLKVLAEREIGSELAPIEMKVNTVAAWEMGLWEEAFSLNSGRVGEIVTLLKEFGIKADEIESISLRAGWHELEGAHLHTNIQLTNGRLFNHSQKVSFNNDVRFVKENLGELNESFGRNVFNGPGKNLYKGKQDFLDAIKAGL